MKNNELLWLMGQAVWTIGSHSCVFVVSFGCKMNMDPESRSVLFYFYDTALIKYSVKISYCSLYFTIKITLFSIKDI